MNNVYIGARYIPKFMGEWNDRDSYEALVIVNFGNESYTSKRPVPVNTPPTGQDDDLYWAPSGGYNGQVAHLQQLIVNETEARTEADDALGDRISSTDDRITSTDTALRQLISNEAAARQAADQALQQEIDNLPISDDPSDRKRFFENKKIMIIGDSLCDPDTMAPNWVTLFKTEVESYGGTVNIDFCNDGDSFAGIAQRLSEFDSYTNIFDIIIVALGVNDYQGQWDIGFYNSTSVVISGGYDSAAGMNMLLNKLRTKFPKAIQYYCPPHRTGAAVQNMKYPITFYRNAFGRIAQYYGMRIIDWSSMPMFAPNALGASFNGYTSSGDKLHPTAAYAPILKEYNIEKLMCGGDNDWKESSDSITLPFSTSINPTQANGYVEVTSHGKTKIKIALSCNFTTSWAYVFESFPAKLLSAIPQMVMVNGKQTRMEPYNNGLIVHMPSGESTALDIYADIEMESAYPMNSYLGITD